MNAIPRRLLNLAVMCFVAALPAVSWACPYCATQNKDAGVGGIVLLGAMIALPFVVFVAVVPALKRAAAQDDALIPPESE